MTGVVLDASALLALLLAEPGADRVKAGLDGSIMMTVNNLAFRLPMAAAVR